MIKYRSTRGDGHAISFSDALLTGLAPDGGLYVPQSWPIVEGVLAQKPYHVERRWTGPELIITTHTRPPPDYRLVAEAVLRPLVGDSIAPDRLKSLIEAAYRPFRHADIAPIFHVNNRIWIMELFHGPTYAFKDVALQLLGHLYDEVLAAQDRRITVIGATSGDTGSAAIEACRDKDRVTIFMLHPKGRISDIQRKQMTHITSENVFNIAIEGSFDDCQDLVKGLFADPEMRRVYGLAAVNSINWARIAAQIVYYFYGCSRLQVPSVAFSVPSGNFGNVYAGYAASRMGAAVGRLIVGTNRNDTLWRFFSEGHLALSPVQETISPSMDVQIPSNLERLLFEMYDRDGKGLAADGEHFRKTGQWQVRPKMIDGAPFASYRFDDDAIIKTMHSVHDETGMILDPHSAIGFAAALTDRDKHDLPIISLATAHPAKFPVAVERAIGRRPDIPDRLAALMDMPERLAVLPNDINRLKDYLRSHAKRINQ